MIKKLVDTNIFIDRLSVPARYKDVFLSEGFIYLSAVVLMELMAGAHLKKNRQAVKEIIYLYEGVGRIVTPSVNDYEKAGEILVRLQNIKGYNLKKCDSITNDCLLAASARSLGAVVYTQNKKDFQAIKDVFDFKVIFV